MLNNLKTYQVYLIHIGVLITIYFLLFLTGVVSFIPNENLLKQWDAGWYKSIVENGYEFQKNQQSNTGFFPLFPFVWGVFGLSNIEISIINYLFFLLGVTFIAKTIAQLKNEVIFLSLSIPSLFFMFVPYSEALFFLTATLYLLGNHYSNNYLKVTALLLASLARPTIFFFLPAIIFSEFLSNDKVSDKLKSIIGLSLIILIGTFLSFYIVGYTSDNFFAYSESQIKNWDHSFSLPNFPLTTWRGYRILWLDFFGLWVVVSALIGTIIFLIKFLKKKHQNPSKNLLLSLSYLSMILVYILFFHPKEEQSQLTSILSLNRYVFCSPFFFYIVYYYYTNVSLKINSVLAFSLVISLLLIGLPYSKIEGLDYSNSLIFGFILVSFIALHIFPMKYNKKWNYYGLYLINCGLQIYLFQSFLKGNWVG